MNYGGGFHNSVTSCVLNQYVCVFQHSVESLRKQNVSYSAYVPLFVVLIGTGQQALCSVKRDVCIYETLWSLCEFLSDCRC